MAKIRTSPASMNNGLSPWAAGKPTVQRKYGERKSQNTAIDVFDWIEV
jgi:hypothetical protein